MRQLSFCAEEGALRVRSGSVHGVTPDRIPDPYAPQHGSPQWAPEHYDLTLDYRVATNALHGVAVVRLRTRADVNRLRFDLHGLTVSKVRVDGVRASFQRGAGQVVVTLPHRLSVGERATVEITYGGKPRPLNSPWGGLGWEELTEGSLVASQPTGAPSWFPCNDHPALRATYRFEMTADSSYTVVANGSLAAKRTRSGHTTWVYEQRQPMATYLAAVHVGRYAQVSLSDHGVEQVAFVPQSLVRRAKHDLPVHRAMMRLFEDVFGPYPFDRYSVVVTADKLDIPIEAQGLSTFGSNHVNGHGGDERMFAHELAHQWFGNAVTLRRWQDMWLNEGFACYAEWLWWDHSGQRTVEATARSHYRRLCGAKRFVHLGDPGPVDMFDDQVYKRGALTLHAVRHSLGDARFFEMVRSWVEWGRVHGATTSSFVAHLWGVDPTGHAAAVCQRWLSSGAPPQFPGAGEGISGLA